MSTIDLHALAKRFGATPVLTDVELEIPSGSLTAILGASGSGKTTLLRLIAGFERLDAGTIAIGGRTLDDARRAVRPQDRGVGYVPQDGALFPHLTVIGNVSFGLSRGRRGRARELLDLVGLGELARRYPHQLSGGQQQRVALARALAIGPAVVLLDEPFGSLDASLRGELRRDVARILSETGTTTILVTHDQDEALTLADQVALLDSGRILACADPRTLYRDPPHAAAAASLGEANILAARIESGRADCALGSIGLHKNGRPPATGLSRLLLRPEQITVSPDATHGAARAVVTELQYHGHDTLVRVRLDHPDQETLLARIPGEQTLQRGQQVWLQVNGLGHAWPLDTPIPTSGRKLDTPAHR